MADSSQEKTEQPTSGRLDDAKKKGQLAYSKELTAAVLFLVGLGALKLSGGEIFASIVDAAVTMLSLPTATFDEQSPAGFVAQLGRTFLTVLSPIFLVAFVATIGPGLMQTNLNLSLQKLQPDFKRLDPIQGVKKLFSIKQVVTVLQSLAKVGLVGVVVWVTIEAALPRLQSLGGAELSDTIDVVLDLVFLLGFRVGAGLVAIGFLDLLFQRWKHIQDMKMTKEDVKEERKRTEGDPRIKGKIREIQRQLALERMKTDVRTADVVVRNPTHFAVALKYKNGEDASPRVVAKGRALMALRIIELAEEAGVEVIENRPLARELYRSVRVGDYIPERLYKAVAEILAFVFKKRRTQGAGR